MRKWVWNEVKDLMQVGKLRYCMYDPSKPLPKKAELKKFGHRKTGGKVKYVILDVWMFACLQGQVAAPLDDPNKAPDSLIGARAFEGVELLKALLTALSEFYPSLEKVGLIRREDGDDACWVAMQFLPRAAKRLGFTLNIVDVSLPKAANGDLTAVVPAFDRNFHVIFDKYNHNNVFIQILPLKILCMNSP